MKKLYRLASFISYKSACNCSVQKMYRGVIENKHQEQMIQFISEGQKQFTQIGTLLNMKDKYTTMHLNILMLNGLLERVLIKPENPTMFYYFLTADGVLLGDLVNDIQNTINKKEKLLTRLLQLNIDNNKK